jgi:tRNA pseudouridine38-40 synthase
MMQRYFIDCAYDGSAYHGWQIQPNGLSVQQTIQQALTVLLKKDIEIVGSGRTDTGVHARQQWAHADMNISAYTKEDFIYKLNCILPQDICVKQILSVIPTAHSRFDAVERTYKYYMHFHKDPFERYYSYFVNRSLDIDKMQSAANELMKFTDFASFCKSNAGSQTTICELRRSEFEVTATGIVFTISANRFLRNMVRAVVGTLIEIGQGRLKPEELTSIIEKKNRSAAGYSVPAHALFLHEVKYSKHIFIN